MMHAEKPLVVAIDGGPCSGKSTILGELQSTDFGMPTVFIPELATVFGAELLMESTDYPRLARENRPRYLDYQRRIIAGYSERIGLARAEMAESGGLIFTDRAAAGVRVYVDESEWEQLMFENGTDVESIKHESADAVVFLGSLAVTNPDKYERERRSNPLRTESLEQAQELHFQSLACWDNHPNVMEIGGDDVVEKSREAQEFIVGLLGKVSVEA